MAHLAKDYIMGVRAKNLKLFDVPIFTFLVSFCFEC